MLSHRTSPMYDSTGSAGSDGAATKIPAPPSVVVKVVSTGLLVLRTSESGPFGALSIKLMAIPQGFTPTDYQWETETDIFQERRVADREANLTLAIGSKGYLVYDHQVRLTARDESGNSATASYTIHVEPPSGRLNPHYDDPASRVRATGGTESEGGFRNLLGYETVLVEADVDGLLGHTTSVWRVGEGVPQVIENSNALVTRMLVTGDPERVESYEGVTVEVSITDEIGQSVMLKEFIEATVEPGKIRPHPE